MKNVEEKFQYDSQNRLTEVRLGTTPTGASSYDSYGRMTAKTANGQAVFSNAVYNTTAKPHALDAATTFSGVFPVDPQTITYTGFDKVSKVKQGNDSICYTYGYDHQRIFMEEHVGSATRTKRYVGNCEYVTETTGNATTQKWLTYLTGPTGVYAVVVTQNNTNTIHYILKDNLGSWTAIVNSSGTVEQRLSYDAWGNLRNPNTWSSSFTGTPMFDRGFTGREHLYNFGLINMNGRMYDPVTSSFLSVDQYVSSPDNAQGFNRYAYCMNNPLRYVDPSGWRPVGGATGYTPNSSSNANDPYAFVEHGGFLEPRDVGKRQFDTSDPIITWMEGNERKPGGNGGGEKTEPTPVADGEDPPEGTKIHSGKMLFLKTFFLYQIEGLNKIGLIPNDFWVDASTINIKETDLVYRPEYDDYVVNLFKDGDLMQGLALGNLVLKRTGEYEYVIQPDEYDFRIAPYRSFGGNVATACGWVVHNFGTPPIFPKGTFMIRFYGTVTVKH